MLHKSLFVQALHSWRILLNSLEKAKTFLERLPARMSVCPSSLVLREVISGLVYIYIYIYVFIYIYIYIWKDRLEDRQTQNDGIREAVNCRDFRTGCLWKPVDS